MGSACARASVKTMLQLSPTSNGRSSTDPRAAVAWVGLGTSLTHLHRSGDAVAKLRRAISLEPAMGEADHALGMAYQSSGDKANAAAAFEKAEQLAAAPPAAAARPPTPATPRGRGGDAR